MATQPLNVTFDENGRPFIILREQESKTRVHGIEALKQHILAATTVYDLAFFICSSF